MASNFYEKIWSERQDNPQDRSLKWEKLQKFIPKEGRIKILDFGCGMGKTMKKISEVNPDADLFGMDVSSTAIERGRKLFPDFDFYEINDGDPLPLEDNSIDFVFSSEVIEHVYDTENAFSELNRVLKKGGKVLITVPYHGLIKNILIALFGFERHFDPTWGHIRFYTKKSLFRVLKDHSFKVEDYGYYGRFYPISHSIYVLARKK